MFIIYRGSRTTPVPSQEVEIRSTWSSECVTRQMTDEERAYYGALTIAAPTNADGIKERRSIDLSRYQKYAHVTKEFVLAEFEQGKTVAQIEREQNMKSNTLYARLKAWGLRSPHRNPEASTNIPSAEPDADGGHFDLSKTDVIADVVRELQRAIQLHPSPLHSVHEGYAVVLKELDEAWDAIKANKPAQARREIAQVAAMAIRYLHDLGGRSECSSGQDAPTA